MELCSSKIKKIPIFQETKLSSPKMKDVFIFFQKNLFRYFWKQNFLKYTSYISAGNIPSSKKKKNPL